MPNSPQLLTEVGRLRCRFNQHDTWLFHQSRRSGAATRRRAARRLVYYVRRAARIQSGRVDRFRTHPALLAGVQEKPDQCRKRLVLAGMSSPQASRFVLLLEHKATAEKFLQRSLTWDRALAEARYPELAGMTPGLQAVHYLVALLFESGRTDLEHPKGIFHLVERPAPLAATR